MNPFDYIKSINQHEYIMQDKLTEKEYNPYITNMSFSMFEDTIFLANEMNRHPSLPNKMQYDFYFNSVRPRKRYKPWPKKDHNFDDVKLICEVYKYNFKRAKEALKLLSDEQIETIRNNYYNKGGL